METEERYLSKLQEMQLKIISHYGLKHQVLKIREESIELALSICRMDILDKNVEDYNITDLSIYANFIEELADVKNLIEQLELLSEDISEGISRNIEYKTNREIARINARLCKKAQEQ